MHTLISDIYQYLKENTSKGGTLYSVCPEKFPTRSQLKQKRVVTRKPVPKMDKIETKKVLQPPVTSNKSNSTTLDKEKETPVKKTDALSIQKEKSTRKTTGVDLKSFYNKYAPNLHVHQTPKDDIVAQRAKKKSSDQKVLSDIVIFTDPRMSDYQKLLSNIAHAIDVKFQPCRLLDISPIEKEDRWENIFSSHTLHLIIIPDVVLFQSPKLIERYKEVKETKTLGGVACFVLGNLEEVQKNPSTKKTLWDEITNAIGK